MWTRASQEVVNIAERLIEHNHPGLHSASIGFLFREKPSKSMGKFVLGKALKVPAHLRPVLTYDFIIWVAEEEWRGLMTEQKDALIDHELCHCGIDEDDQPILRSHDIEEFNCIIERYGFWNKDLMNTSKYVQMHLFPGLEKVEVEYIKAGRVDAVDPEQMPEGALV